MKRNNNGTRPGAFGFTLIELMITVAIVAILAAIAYPSYTRYVVRAKRVAAQGFLQTLVNRQEQFMLNARSYFAVADGTTAQWSTVSITVPSDVSVNYTFTMQASNSVPVGYTVTATPIGAQLGADTDCGTLKLNSIGAKSASGTGTQCW